MSPSRNPNREYLPIPSQKTPPEYVCFCCVVPDNPEHFAAFWGALEMLAQRYSWGKPLTEDSEIVALYWADVLRENRQRFDEAIT